MKLEALGRVHTRRVGKLALERHQESWSGLLNIALDPPAIEVIMSTGCLTSECQHLLVGM
jgi:hypothetical protein